MQTQCPNCETRFRVTETQITIADGHVRCGACDEVFSVYEVADQVSLDSEQQLLLREFPLSSQIDEDPSNTSTEKDSELYAIEDSDDDQDSSNDLENLSAYDADDLDENILSDELEAVESEPVVPEPVVPEPVVPEPIGSEHVGSEKDSYNFFEDDDSTGHVVPEEFRDSYQSDTTSIASTVLWGIGILLLTTALFVEYAWFNRNKFTHIPEVQAEIDKLCQQLNCQNLSLRVPAKIELVTRNIYSHPNEKDVLLVNVTMKNNAAYSQPYPVIKIDFSDVRGGIVASRNFRPSEYLATDTFNSNKKTPLLPPDASSSIAIEIQDPGKQAMTYEFNFL